MKRIFCALLGVALFAGHSVFAASWNVFGVDNRVDMTSTSYPWSTIGYLDSGCTGTLVARNLVLTAAHCVVENGTMKYIGNFNPNYIGGYSRRKSWVKRATWGSGIPETYRADDWAILELEDNLGDDYGWMGTESTVRTYVALAGYSEDYHGGQTAGVHVDCQFRDTLGGFWMHDCDNARGASGGPMFYQNSAGEAYIVAINVAERRDNGTTSLHLGAYEESHANIAVPVKAFLAKLRELKGE
jgi:protease YdgD